MKRGNEGTGLGLVIVKDLAEPFASIIAPDVKMLVVDDNEFNRQVMLSLLKPTLMLMDDVESGREALEMLEIRQYDLILLDIAMPGMDGYRVLDHLREDEKTKEIPVVFLTGLTDETTEMQAFEREVLDYLKKPVGMRVLLMRVKHYLDLTEARKDSMAGSLDERLLEKLPEPLTARESDVANLMAQFRSDREISEMLNISMPYTKKLVGTVKEKLGIEKRGEIRKYIR